MKPEGLLLYEEQSTTVPYPKPDKSNPQLCILLPQGKF